MIYAGSNIPPMQTYKLLQAKLKNVKLYKCGAIDIRKRETENRS